MTTIRLYWNNICVLHRQELQFLNEIREELRKDNIDLDITCFGLGYGRHMSDYLREEDSVLPDLVVSTDLEVFEDERIWNRFREHGLLPLKEFFPVKDIPELGGLKKLPLSFPILRFLSCFTPTWSFYARPAWMPGALTLIFSQEPMQTVSKVSLLTGSLNHPFPSPMAASTTLP